MLHVCAHQTRTRLSFSRFDQFGDLTASFSAPQRLEKLCRSILSSMDAENEPKVCAWELERSSVDHTDAQSSVGRMNIASSLPTELYLALASHSRWLLPLRPESSGFRVKVPAASPLQLCSHTASVEHL